MKEAEQTFSGKQTMSQDLAEIEPIVSECRAMHQEKRTINIF